MIAEAPERPSYTRDRRLYMQLYMRLHRRGQTWDGSEEKRQYRRPDRAHRRRDLRGVPAAVALPSLWGRVRARVVGRCVGELLSVGISRGGEA